VANPRTDGQIIEDCCRIELCSRSPEELDGAHRALCVLVMAKTSLAIKERPSGLHVRKKWLHAQQDAARWLAGGVGEWNLQSVCEALGMDAAFVRSRLARYAASARAKSINTAAPRKVFGRLYNANSSPETASSC
jgi:hypothetical protein